MMGSKLQPTPPPSQLGTQECSCTENSTRPSEGGNHRVLIVWSVSHLRLFVTPWTAACQASVSFTISQSLLKLMSIESVMPSNHLILCCPLLLLPSIFSSVRVFSSESALCIQWPKDWSFSFNISPSSECSGLVSFKIDWSDLLAVQGTLQSLLQHHSSSVSNASQMNTQGINASVSCPPCG